MTRKQSMNLQNEFPKFDPIVSTNLKGSKYPKRSIDFDLIQNKFDVTHQSPQLLVIKNGKVVAHDSHYGVLDVNF